MNPSNTSGDRPFGRLLKEWRKADARIDGTPDTMALFRRLCALAEEPMPSETLPPDDSASPVLAIHFRRGDTSLRLFTTIATLGTPRDITTEEIRIEFFFPLVDAAAAICQEWQ